MFSRTYFLTKSMMRPCLTAAASSCDVREIHLCTSSLAADPDCFVLLAPLTTVVTPPLAAWLFFTNEFSISSRRLTFPSWMDTKASISLK